MTQTLTDNYPSRVTEDPKIIERTDPPVWGSASGGPLDADAVSSFGEKGYLFFPELFSADEVHAYSREITRLSSDPRVVADERTITEPKSDEVRSIFEVHRSSDAFRDLCKDPRIVEPMRQLLGSDVYIHQSRVNYKPGFRGKEFYWHSDFETWHCEDGMPHPRAISCSILLTDNSSANGPLLIIPGSHKLYVQTVGETPEDHYKHSLKQQDIGVPDDRSLAELAERGGGIDVLAGPKGSVVFFECNAMHGSNGNITPYPRSNVFYVYNSVENTLVEPFAAPKPRPTFIGSRDFTPVDEL